MHFVWVPYFIQKEEELQWKNSGIFNKFMIKLLIYLLRDPEKVRKKSRQQQICFVQSNNAIRVVVQYIPCLAFVHTVPVIYPFIHPSKPLNQPIKNVCTMKVNIILFIYYIMFIFFTHSLTHSHSLHSYIS